MEEKSRYSTPSDFAELRPSPYEFSKQIGPRGGLFEGFAVLRFMTEAWAIPELNDLPPTSVQLFKGPWELLHVVFGRSARVTIAPSTEHIVIVDFTKQFEPTPQNLRWYLRKYLDRTFPPPGPSVHSWSGVGPPDTPIIK